MKKQLVGFFLLLGLMLGSPLRAFISPDPEGHVASMDLYSYCDGDPVNQYDADGRIGKGAATGVALGGFGQYDNTTQQIAGLVGQVGSYFIPGMQGYSAARDIAFSGYSASKAAYDIGENGLNTGNGAAFAMSVVGLIPGGGAIKSEATAVVNGLENAGKTITLDALPAAEGTRPTLFANQFPEDAVGVPIQTFSPVQLQTKTGVFNYVVTEDESLVVGRFNNQTIGGGHIDLANGAAVQAAGEVKVINGQIKYIDNSSGHYLPSGTSAQDAAINAFNNAGFNATGTYVEKVWNGSTWVPK